MKKHTTYLGMLAILFLAVAAGVVYLISVDIPAPQEQREIVIDHAPYFNN